MSCLRTILDRSTLILYVCDQMTLNEQYGQHHVNYLTFRTVLWCPFYVIGLLWSHLVIIIILFMSPQISALGDLDQY